MYNRVIEDGVFNIRKRGIARVKPYFGQLWFGVFIAILMLQIPMVLFNHYFPSEGYLEMLGQVGDPNEPISIAQLIQEGVNGIAALYQVIVQGPLVYGLFKLVWTAYNGKNTGALTVIEGFSTPVKTIGLNLYITLLTALWSLAIVIPMYLFAIILGGYYAFYFAFIMITIIAVAIVVITLRYYLVYLIAVEDSSLGIRDTVKLSITMLKGNKGKLFKLILSFILEIIAVSIVFAVASIALDTLGQVNIIIRVLILVLITAAIYAPIVVRVLASICEFFVMLTGREEQIEEPKLS